MQTNQSTNGARRRHPVFGYAAYDGVYAGIYFMSIILCAAYSGQAPLLGIAALGMMVSVPFLTYRLLRARRADRPKERPVSTVWIEGVYTYVFGALLMTLGVYLWLRVSDPGYLQQQVETALRLTASQPETAHLHQAIQANLSAAGMPTPIDVAISLFWPVAFSGSMVSLLVAVFMNLFNRQSSVVSR